MQTAYKDLPEPMKEFVDMMAVEGVEVKVPKKKEIYIAGPMSGYAEFNFPAFFAAADKMTAEGYVVWNPASKDNEANVVADESFSNGDDQKLMANGWDFKSAFLWDVTKVIQSDAIYMLPGWEFSSGARAEHAVAVSIKQRYPEYKIIYG